MSSNKSCRWHLFHKSTRASGWQVPYGTKGYRDRPYLGSYDRHGNRENRPGTFLSKALLFALSHESWPGRIGANPGTSDFARFLAVPKSPPTGGGKGEKGGGKGGEKGGDGGDFAILSHRRISGALSRRKAQVPQLALPITNPLPSTVGLPRNAPTCKVLPSFV